jgi:hypothetical protein
MSDEQLKSMGIDRNELKKLQSGTHPTNARAAETLRAVARYDASINPNSYQAKAVLAGLEYRSKSNFYSQPMKTLADITPTKKARTKTGVVDGQTGRAKPTSVGVVGGGIGDRRQVAVGKGETVLNKKTTSAIRGGRTAFIPGLGKIRIAGAEQGIPTGQQTGSTTIGAVSQSAELTRAQLRAAAEGTSLKESKRRIAAETRLANAMDDTTKAQMTTKEKLTQFSSKAGVGIGAMSGLTIAASFAGGQVGEMAQKIMPFVFGLQGITMLLPMLANPWVAAIAAIAVVGGVFTSSGIGSGTGTALLTNLGGIGTLGQVYYVRSILDATHFTIEDQSGNIITLTDNTSSNNLYAYSGGLVTVRVITGINHNFAENENQDKPH